MTTRTTLAELFRSPLASPRLKPECDPLAGEDILMECQVLDVRAAALTSQVGVLLEARTALQFPKGNTAVLIFQGVTECVWTAEPRERPTAWTVVNSVPKPGDTELLIALHLCPDAVLTIRASAAHFYVGNVGNLPDAPPDYTDPTWDGATGLPNWSSTIDLLGQSSLGQFAPRRGGGAG